MAENSDGVEGFNARESRTGAGALSSEQGIETVNRIGM